MKHSRQPYTIDDLSSAERELLQDQFKQSRFYEQQQRLPQHKRHRPVCVDIFDFDSTLFLSPAPSPNLWDASFISALIKENYIGPGWWRDLRSLQVAPEASSSDQQQNKRHPDYSRFWNEDVVKQVQRSFDNPNRLTVLLTGRRYHPFFPLVKQILASRGLDKFDVMGLRPDPITVKTHNNPIVEDRLNYIEEPNVFRSTMAFKLGFIINLLNSVPSLRKVEMWEDRLHHVKEFKAYLRSCVSRRILDKGVVIYVEPIRPRYNAAWQLKTIRNILDSHNNAVNELRKINAESFKKGPSSAQLTMAGTEQGNRIGNLFGLRPVNRYYVLRLSKDTTNHLKDRFERYYKRQLECDKNVKEWQRKHGEEPIFFGSDIILTDGGSSKHRNALRAKYPELFDENARSIKFEVVDMSKVTYQNGFFLKVVLCLGRKRISYILPLWLKPSENIHLLERNIVWQDNKDVEKRFHLKSKLLHGKLSTLKTYTLNNLDENPPIAATSVQHC